MKNKILNVSVLFMALALVFVAFNVNAKEDNSVSNSVGVKVQNSLNTSNEGEELKIQVQNQEKLEVGSKIESDSKVEINQENKREEDNSNEKKEFRGNSNDNEIDDDGMLDNDNDNDNDNESEVEDRGNSDDDNGKRETQREERKSMVANAVQAMLQFADKNEGIGEQVRVIAQAQNESHSKIETKLKSAQDRSNFVKFLIGPKYNDIDEAKVLLEQNKEQIKQLSEIKTKISNEVDAQVLNQQIRVLEQANLEIDNSLDVSEKGFSLLGWMYKMLSK